MKTKLLFTIFLFCTLSSNAQNLIAYYPFNGSANDESGNGINPSYIGAGVTLTTDRFGIANKAYNFDGATGSYIKLPADLLPTTNRTVSLWFNVPDVTNRPGLLSYGGNGSCGTTLLMGLNLLGIGQYYVQGHCGNNAAAYSYTTAPINNWYHWVVTIDGSAQKIYVNGELKSTDNTFNGSTVVSGTDLSFGVITSISGTAPYTDVNVGYLNGKLDDISIYDSAMTDLEVQNLYNNEANNLVAYYSFDGDANDESGNNHHGTLVNTPTFTLDRFGNPEKAISFDKNASQFVNIPDNPALRIDTELTLSVFVKRKTLAGNDHLINKGGEYNSGSCNYDLSFSDASFVFKYNGSYHVGYVVHDMNWHHYAITTYNGSPDVKFYIDGVYSPTWINGGTIDLRPTTHSDLQIGGTIYYTNTTLDDVRIYNRILSPTEIGKLYSNNSLKIEKVENGTTKNFYVNNSTLYFKSAQNLNEINSVEVYNLLGQKVFNTSKIKAEIFLNHFTKGVYILKVKYTDGKISSLRFLMEY